MEHARCRPAQERTRRKSRQDRLNAAIDRSPDIEGVRRIFATLSEFMTALKGEFQVIVTEHAGAITWREIDKREVVARVPNASFKIVKDSGHLMPLNESVQLANAIHQFIAAPP